MAFTQPDFSVCGTGESRKGLGVGVTCILGGWHDVPKLL